MKRPLIISDCDEVLLYMISHFRDWLAEEQGIHFAMGSNDFSRAMTYVETGEIIEQADIWRLLNLFFDGQMHRQLPVNGAVNSIAELKKHADVVVLTNLNDFRQEARARQLAEHGIELKVYTNQGPKGPALKAIIDEFNPSRAIFIDDLAQHHDSVCEIAPDVGRLHLCAEPTIASHITCAHEAGHAHARIDDWAQALPWMLDRLYSEVAD